MPGSYSQDLWDRVIDAVERDGLSRRAAARRFGVSESSAIKWVQRYRRTGARGPVGTGGHRRSVLEPHRNWLMAVLAEIGRAHVCTPVTNAHLVYRLLLENTK